MHYTTAVYEEWISACFINSQHIISYPNVLVVCGSGGRVRLSEVS